MGAMMPLTMRPTGGHSPVYADRQDWTILDDGKPVGRVYEDASASTPRDLRWFWSITVYVDPRAGICASGKGNDRAGWLHAVRLIRLILWVSSSNGVRNKHQAKMTSDGVQATIIPSRNA